jgi:hypothetical protein
MAKGAEIGRLPFKGSGKGSSKTVKSTGQFSLFTWAAAFSSEAAKV